MSTSGHIGNKYAAKHNGSGTPAYRSWITMRNRCNNPKHHQYARYRAIGVAVCERWSKFENFLADMGPRPAGTTLDRYPNRDGNYEPDNCRWATHKQQQRNRRNGLRVTWEGADWSLPDLVEHLRLDYGIVLNRVRRKWPLEQALFGRHGNREFRVVKSKRFPNGKPAAAMQPVEITEI